jgi:Schlafen, AlbA_2
MAPNANRIDRALKADRESGDVEFKERFDPRQPRDSVELVKHMVAIANSGGGAIVFGVDDYGAPVRDPVEVLALDPAEITKKIHKYTEEHFSSFEICKAEKDGRSVAVIGIDPADVPMVFAKPGTYADGAGQKTAFGQGTVYFRHGAQSAPGATADLRESIDRIRREWGRDLRRVIDAPLGSVVEVRSPGVDVEETSSATPIRLTDDPDAAPYRIVNPDQTHPYRTKEIVGKINDSLPAGARVNVYDVMAIREVYGLNGRYDMVHAPRYGPRQFSPLFASWVAAHVAEDPRFLRTSRQRYRTLRRSRRMA